MRRTLLLLIGVLAAVAGGPQAGSAAEGERARELASRLGEMSLGQAAALRDAGRYEAALERLEEARGLAREFDLPAAAIERAERRTVETQRLRAGNGAPCDCRRPIIQARLLWSPPIF